MSIFSRKKKTDEAKAPKGNTEIVPAEKSGISGKKFAVSEIALGVKRPRITEKASFMAENGNVYAFEVEETATKGSLSRAIAELYKVEPVKINIVNLPAKKVFVRGKVGIKSGVKKAYVYLKKGEKIETA